ncbi:MAG: DUF4240 domain-containing protein [Flavobacteriaceae bacterium]|jgi:hypothetical protein|nr:DUF4240 domain-containing protein [Flavobacteriaceae bacterium]
MNRKELVKDLKPCSTLMGEEQYWNIIAASLANSDDQSEQYAYIVKALDKLSLEEIIGFSLTTSHLTNEIYTSHMWCAGYIMNGGCSDDGFIDFRNWVVSRGKEVYYAAKAKPDSLINEVDVAEDEYAGFEEFGYVAGTVFENATETKIYDYIDSPIKYNLDITFDWDDDDEESMRVICPQLYAYYDE